MKTSLFQLNLMLPAIVDMHNQISGCAFVYHHGNDVQVHALQLVRLLFSIHAKQIVKLDAMAVNKYAGDAIRKLKNHHQ